MRGPGNRGRAALVAAALTWASPGRAEDPRPPAAADHVVKVFVAGTHAAVERARTAVTELCARIDVRAVVEEAPDESAVTSAPRGGLAAAFVDLRTPTSPRLVVVQGDTHRELERRTLPTSASLELSVEATALVLYMVVESQLQRRDADGDRSTLFAGGADSGAHGTGTAGASDGAASTPSTPQTETAPPVPAPVPEPTEPARDDGDDDARHRAHADEDRGHLEVDLAAFGLASVADGSHVLPGFGASLGAGIRSGDVRLGAALSAAATLDRTLATGGNEASVGLFAPRLLGVAEWRVGARVSPWVGLGGGVDRVRVATSGTPSGGYAAGIETRVDPVLEALLGVRVRLLGNVHLTAAAALDVDLAPRRYVAIVNGEQTTLLDFRRVRPAALVGLSFALSGQSTREGDAE